MTETLQTIEQQTAEAQERMRLDAVTVATRNQQDARAAAEAAVQAAREADRIAAGLGIVADFTTVDSSAQIAAQAAEIADLKARLDAARVRGENNPVELADGTTATTKETSARLDSMSIDAEIELAKSRRFIAMLADRELENTPVPSQRPLLTKDEAEHLLGRTQWEKLTNAEKAAVLDIRQGDLDKLNPRDYFGKGSDSLLAHRLSQANLGVYKLVKLQAQALGLI